MKRAVVAMWMVLYGSTAIAAEPADRIWRDGTILTMNDAAMRAEAVAERDGRIVAVGSESDVMAFKGPQTEVVDLEGRTMLPGFFDAHGHVFMGGLQALSANLLAPPDGEVADIASLQQTLRDWAAANAEAVAKYDLIIGFGYDNAQLAELRHPTRDDLDEVSRDVPIVIIHQSGHLAALNSAALEVVGYEASTEDPEGGVIRRRAGSREPDGVLEETAFFAAIVRLMGDIGEAGARAFAEAGSELWAQFGYTTAEEGRSLPSTVAMLGKIADEGGFAIDIVTYVDVLADRDFIKANQSETYRNRFRVAGAKLTIDGSPQGFTAWRDRPYVDPVGDYPPGYTGYAAATRDQVVDAVKWAYANDVQLLTHANGEAATDLLIAANQAALAEHGPTTTRPVLIHGQFLRSDQLDAIKRLGIMPSLFPMHTFYWGDWHREHTVGPELVDDISPTGWCVQRGIKFSSHHDAPVAFPDSMRILDATVTRRSRSGDIVGPAQRVDVITALKAMTIWPAWQHHEEARKGSIEVGKLADLVILSADPTTVDPETLDQIKVVETIKEGTTVYAMPKVDGGNAGLTALVGSWTLVALDGGPVEPVGKPITLEIAEDGAVAGVSGVNRFMTRLETADPIEGRLAFAPAAGTRMAGPPEAMALEQTFLARLSTVTTYAVDGNTLRLWAADNEALTFARAR
ncbi:MAG TPA: amidohydrolase family protein [Candidatus Sulfomarinibacteraceae bacterium]|nr:amidohydrolase family protein [Candidatus Sulfomarinibacteraceae bacterium]